MLNLINPYAPSILFVGHRQHPDPNQTPQNAASDQGLLFMLTECSIETIQMKNTTKRRLKRKWVKLNFSLYEYIVHFFTDPLRTALLASTPSPATIGPPAKRHLNGVLLLGRWWGLLGVGFRRLK